jgi:hypothetical protein
MDPPPHSRQLVSVSRPRFERHHFPNMSQERYCYTDAFGQWPSWEVNNHWNYSRNYHNWNPKVNFSVDRRLPLVFNHLLKKWLPSVPQSVIFWGDRTLVPGVDCTTFHSMCKVNMQLNNVNLRDEKCLKNLGQKTWREKITWETWAQRVGLSWWILRKGDVEV